MIEVLIEISRFVFPLLALMMLMTALKLHEWHTHGDTPRRNFYSVLQKFVILATHALGFAILLFKSDFSTQVIVLYTMELGLFIVMFILFALFYKKANVAIANLILYMLSISFIILARLDLDIANKQYRMIVIGLVAYLIVAKVFNKLFFLEHLNILYAIVSFGLLIMANQTVNGSKNWFSYGSISFQPSEIVKLTLVLFLATAFKKYYMFNKVLYSGAITGLIILLLVSQKDLGTSLIFYVLYLSLLYIYSDRKSFLLLGTFGGMAATFVAYLAFAHVRVRADAWLDPWKYIDSKGYQITQSLFAINTWGFLGSGLTKGMPEKIPVVSTDFIFAAVSEEFGNFFGIILILLFLSLIIIIFKESQHIRKPFYKLVNLGICFIFAFQTFLIIGGVTALIPLTGVTLPFISYGGTSIVMTLVMMAVVQSICMVTEEAASTTPLHYSQLPGFDPTMPYIAPLTVHYPTQSTEETLSNGYPSHFAPSNAPSYSMPGMALESEETPDPSIQMPLLRCSKRVMLGYGFLFVLLVANIVYMLTMERDQMIVNTYNPRMAYIEANTVRGKILDSHGTVIAQTTLSKGGQVRKYPFKSDFAHIVGYSYLSKTGIEALENIQLLSPNLSLPDRITAAVSGDTTVGSDVVTTLDQPLQTLANKLLGKKKGAIVAIDPTTGKILCMVSNPDFDTNKILENWDTLKEDEKNYPLVNRATQGLYPPGSTFKILTTIGYLEDFSASDFQYRCEGEATFGDKVIHCSSNKSHGEETLTDAFANSCNTAFASIGSELNLTAFVKLSEKFLYNQTLPYPLPYSKSVFQLSNQPNEAELSETIIGQGKTLVTPLHSALIVSSIANGGILMKPYLIDSIINAQGDVVKKYYPEPYETLMTPELSEQIKDFMIEVTENGTGKTAAVQGIQIAGKTGSAENSFGDPHAWYVGFAPADQPKIALAIIVENSGSSSKNAAPIAKSLFEAYLK